MLKEIVIVSDMILKNTSFFSKSATMLGSPVCLTVQKQAKVTYSSGHKRLHIFRVYCIVTALLASSLSESVKQLVKKLECII